MSATLPLCRSHKGLYAWDLKLPRNHNTAPRTASTPSTAQRDVSIHRHVPLDTKYSLCANRKAESKLNIRAVALQHRDRSINDTIVHFSPAGSPEFSKGFGRAYAVDRGRHVVARSDCWFMFWMFSHLLFSATRGTPALPLRRLRIPRVLPRGAE